MQNAQSNNHSETLTGYLDHVFEALKLYQHPFVLVDTLAARWMGSNGSPDIGFDLLVRTHQLDDIAADLITNGHWKLHDRNQVSHRYEEAMASGLCHDERNREADTVLERVNPDPDEYLIYLRLWSEDVYLISVDGPAVEVPEVVAWTPHLVEAKYHPAADRDDGHWYGPRTLTHTKVQVVIPKLGTARSDYINTPIYIPAFHIFLDAMLDHKRLYGDSRPGPAFSAGWHLWNLTRYLFLELPHQRLRIMSVISERNRETTVDCLESFQRKTTIDIHPVTRETVVIKPWEKPEPWELRAKLASKSLG